MAKQLAVPLTAFTIGPGGAMGDPDTQWANLYGVTSQGAVLVRPDGHVGWRRPTAPAGTGGELARALRRLLATS